MKQYSCGYYIKWTNYDGWVQHDVILGPVNDGGPSFCNIIIWGHDDTGHLP